MKNNRKVLAAALMLAGSTAAIAQVSPVRPQYTFPEQQGERGAGAVQIGGSPFYLAPFAGVGAGYDDNLFQSANNKRDSWLLTLSGGAVIDYRDSNKVFRASYSGIAGRYTSSRNDDYQDHTVRVSFDMMATREAAFRLGYEYLRGHDARGSTDRPSAFRPDEYESNTAGVMFAYGQKDARARVEAFYSQTDREYINNRIFTAGSDRDTKEAGVAGYFRIAPKTQILAEYRRTDIDYALASSLQSGTEERTYGGVTWEATAATSGTIKVGQLKKDFDSGLPGFSDIGWEGLITWSPRTYSKFDFYSSRTPIESTGEGSFILSDATGVVWTHAWSSFLTTDVSARYQKDKYQSNPRKDEVTTLGVGAKYQLRRWLQFGAQYTYTNRDSTTPLDEYDRNLWLLSLSATL
jgi:hypothetical protein